MESTQGRHRGTTGAPQGHHRGHWCDGTHSSRTVGILRGGILRGSNQGPDTPPRRSAFSFESGGWPCGQACWAGYPRCPGEGHTHATPTPVPHPCHAAHEAARHARLEAHSSMQRSGGPAAEEGYEDGPDGASRIPSHPQPSPGNLTTPCTLTHSSTSLSHPHPYPRAPQRRWSRR